VLLEITATKNLERRSGAQALNYLSASDLELALILNFGEKPEFKRLVLTNDRKHRPQPLKTPRKSVEIGGPEDPWRSVATAVRG